MKDWLKVWGNHLANILFEDFELIVIVVIVVLLATVLWITLG